MFSSRVMPYLIPKIPPEFDSTWCHLHWRYVPPPTFPPIDNTYLSPFHWLPGKFLILVCAYVLYHDTNNNVTQYSERSNIQKPAYAKPLSAKLSAIEIRSLSLDFIANMQNMPDEIFKWRERSVNAILLPVKQPDWSTASEPLFMGRN